MSMKATKVILIIGAVVIAFWATVFTLASVVSNLASEDKAIEISYDVNNTFDTSDIVWQGDFTIPIGKAVHIGFYFQDVNNMDEAVSALRKQYRSDAKEVIDIEVTIGDETHTTSFEDFFEWIGFER